jgi:7-keto-8-aminopelargonate synthetase-like enzyme
MVEPEPLQQIDRTYVRYRGRKLSYFSGCDYFRMASHAKVIQATVQGVREFGLNVAASRLTTGNHRVYKTLEAQLARYFTSEAALLVSNGYAAPMVVAQALAGNFSHVLIDEHAHPALQDAALALNCPVLAFPHQNPSALAGVLKRIGRRSRPVVLTDGMFSHNGSIAPLKAYLKELPRDGWMLVDDAHGAGILGKTGKGTIERESVDRSRVIQCITLSKAFGVYGGAVLGTNQLRTLILNRSRTFVGSTPFPLPLAQAALVAVKILASDPHIRRRLFENSDYVKQALRRSKLSLANTPGPIIPIYPAGHRETLSLKQRLLQAKIYPPFLMYPGGPKQGYFRFVISSEHRREQLDNLVTALKSHR